MKEPEVSSSEATNIEYRNEKDGKDYIVNGRKWWTSGAGDPRCKISIFMGKNDPDAAKHEQQSMILVPMDTPGVNVVRKLDRKSTRLNSSHVAISYAVFCLKKKKQSSI